MARWDACSAQFEEKLYIFGGHSLDGRSKNSMLTLDLKAFYLSTLKTSNPPSPRDGSCLLNYQSSFLLFGGSDGGEEDTEPYNDFWQFDIPTRTWKQRKTRGESPRPRDGHAGGVVSDHLVIYGGNDLRNILHDIQALNLKTYEWTTLRQVGDRPGPRESMGYTSLHNKLYVFGGNTNGPSKSDAYSNDLFEISLLNSSAQCKKLSSEGPAKRLSCSMVAMNGKLAIFGGESFGVLVNDLWLFDLDDKAWSEVHTVNKVPPRMAHVSCVYSRGLLIYGGMDMKRNPLSDISMLDYADVSPQEIPESPSWSCEICSHSSKACSFLLDFPQLNTYSFYINGQLPVIQKASNEFPDDLAAMVYLATSMDKLSIDIVGTVKCRKNFMVQSIPEPQEFDLGYLENTGSHMKKRKEKIREMCKDIDSKAYVMQLFCPEVLLSPNEVAELCSGQFTRLNLGALFKLTESLLIVSKTEDLISVVLMKKEENSLPVYFVIVNSELDPLFPGESVFYPNWRNIETGSHINKECLKSAGIGTSFFVYSERIVPHFQENDILFSGVLLRAFLSYVFYKPPLNFQVSVNAQAVSLVDIGHMCEYKIEGDPEATYFVVENFYAFSLMFYYRNCLVYWEMKGTEEAKRRRNQDVTVIVKTNLKKVVNKKTGLLNWNHYSARILFSLQEPYF